MGFFSALFGGGSGLSNSSTNMKDPLGYEACLRLCMIYDSWGGAHIGSPARRYHLVKPGMVLYPILIAPDGYKLHRGVLFSLENGDEDFLPYIFQHVDYGDGGIPTFSTIGSMKHINGDLYRLPEPLTERKDGQMMSIICELNWNTRSGEFAYRELCTPVNDK